MWALIIGVAGIAKAEINKVGWTAFFYGLTCYLLPFIFFYGPPLLMQGSAMAVLLAGITGFLGVFCIASFVVGCLENPLQLPSRLAIGLAGLALLIPGLITDATGFILLILVHQFQRRTIQRSSQHS